MLIRKWPFYGICVFLLALILCSGRMLFMITAEKATGRVLECLVTNTRSGRTVSTTVEFNMDNVVQTGYFTTYLAYEPDEEISILYTPGDRDSIVVNSFWEVMGIWRLAVLAFILVFGSIFFAVIVGEQVHLKFPWAKNKESGLKKY
jgi:hypothetical protein